MKKGGKSIFKEVSLFVLLFVIMTIFISPVLHTFLTSIKEPVDAFSLPPKWIFKPTLSHHLFIWTERPFPRYLLNTLIISIGTVTISVPAASLCAYALSRYRTKKTSALLFSILAVRMFPRMLLLIPFFLMAKYFKLYDTYSMMILIMVAVNQPFSIWLMRGFFLDVPKELDEAAMVDGCSRFRAFWQVVLPVVRPGLVATTIFSFLLAYNEFLFALVLTGTNTKTLPVVISEYGAEKIEYWSFSAAGAIGIMAPIVIFMIIIQKHIIKGLTFGVIK